MSYYNGYSRDDDNTDDGYDAARDRYNSGESNIPVTRRQREEEQEARDEDRRNRPAICTRRPLY